MDIVNEHLSYQYDEKSHINVNMMTTWNQKIKEIVGRLKKNTQQKNHLIPQMKRL